MVEARESRIRESNLLANKFDFLGTSKVSIFFLFSNLQLNFISSACNGFLDNELELVGFLKVPFFIS